MRALSHRLLLAVLAVVALAVVQGCGSSYSPTTPPPGGQADATITILGMNGGASFSPDPGLVPVGKTVAWRNADTGVYGGGSGTAHHIVADGGAFDTGVLAPGAVSGPTMMSTAGTFTYKCVIHPTMTGSVTVQ